MEMIKAEHSETRVMLLLDQEHEFWNALQLNADGYELRELIPFQLAVAIKTIGEGYTWIGGKLSSYLLKGDNREHLISLSQRESSKSVIACLSIREREVISLLSEGLNTTQIADKMAISPKTVKLYITNCIKKLNVENRSQAIVKFLQAKPTTTAS
jgi:DNA-binding NarL/FixJ family response regulator